MFSFFKRSKSKDDSAKDKNAKDKSSSSPFSKRHEPSKAGNNSKTVPPVEVVTKPCFSFPVGDSNAKVETPNTHTENGHIENTKTELINKETAANLKCNGFNENNNNTFQKQDGVHKIVNKSPHLSREEFFKSMPTPLSTDDVSADRNLETKHNLFDFPTDVSVNCDPKEGVKCKSEEEETPTETEVVFKTAPNTPVLAKHLTLTVSNDNIFIDDDIFCESFAKHGSEKDASVEIKQDENSLVKEILDEIHSNKVSLEKDKSVEIQPNKNSLEKDEIHSNIDSLEKDTSVEIQQNKESVEIRPNKDTLEKETPNEIHLNKDSPGEKTPLGLDLDLPDADSDSDEDTASTVLENPELERTPEQESSTAEETTASKVETSRPAELPPYPGELYDIAEESTSEDEEEEDEDSDSDPAPSESKTTDPLPQDITKKNMVNQEAKFQEQVGDLAAQLEARENESKQLLYQIDELQRDVDAKTGGMDHGSSDNNIIRIMELEDKIKEMADKIKNLETQLQAVKEERDKLQSESTEMKNEREEEKKIVQEALDEALTEKETIQRRFEQDFEKLRTVNTDREQQLLDDFEWKLREVEQMCKKRLEDKEKAAKQRIKEVEDKLTAAEKDLSRVETLKQYEAEAVQLRGVNSEQQKALKVASKTSEQLQMSEKTLTEEVQRLKNLLEREKKNLTTVQGIHNREIAEKDRKLLFKLEQQKNELNSEWEEKLRKESVRIKSEVEKQHRDEKRHLLDKYKEEKEEELRTAKLKWTTKQQDIQKEVEVLKERLAEQGHKHQKEVSDAQTNSDRDIFDLRRKLDKIDITYQEEIEKMQEKHETEMARLTEEHEKKLQQCEQNWQLQIGTTRTTLELVKEQLQREAQDKLQALSEQHRRQLEEQWEQLVQERDETVADLEQRHRASTEKLRAELDTIYKARNTRENEV